MGERWEKMGESWENCGFPEGGWPAFCRILARYTSMQECKNAEMQEWNRLIFSVIAFLNIEHWSTNFEFWTEFKILLNRSLSDVEVTRRESRTARILPNKFIFPFNLSVHQFTSSQAWSLQPEACNIVSNLLITVRVQRYHLLHCRPIKRHSIH